MLLDCSLPAWQLVGDALDRRAVPQAAVSGLDWVALAAAAGLAVALAMALTVAEQY